MAVIILNLFFIFFFQAEDGIRDYDVTGVQTCALPILQNPVQCQIEPASRWSTRTGLEIIDSGKAVLLHQAVLVIPESHQHENRERRPHQSQNRKTEDDQRSNEQSVFPALQLIGKPVGPQPGGKMMRNRDPQSHGSRRGVRHPVRKTRRSW